MLAVDKDGKMIDDDVLQIEILMEMGGLSEDDAKLALAIAKGESKGDVVNVDSLDGIEEQ